MKYQQRGDYFLGFADLTISEMGRSCPGFFDGMSLLITCLDSTTPDHKLARWMRMLDERNYAAEHMDDGIWIPAERTVRLLAEGLTFYGFDEVYLFKTRPVQQGLRRGIFTTDGYNFAEVVPPDFVNAFFAMGATRYLSDGCGMNFACESLASLRLIEGLAGSRWVSPEDSK